jgi:hypothetical protein
MPTVVATLSVTGIGAGAVIRLISGFVFVVLLSTILQPSKTTGDVLKITGEIVTLPTSMFGGHWLGSQLFQPIARDFSSAYVAALAVIFFVVTVKSTFLAVRVVNKQLTKLLVA